MLYASFDPAFSDASQVVVKRKTYAAHERVVEKSDKARRSEGAVTFRSGASSVCPIFREQDS